MRVTSDGARTQVSLDGEWEFTSDPGRQIRLAELPRVPMRSIRVPGPWQAQFADLRDYSGLAWYRHTFTLPVADRQPDPRLERVLHFGAVDYFATVWLNGHILGEHEGGYLPFELPADDALRFDGLNELVVRVIDPGNEADADLGFSFSEIPHGKQSWYGPVGGIWQSVYLERRSIGHIARVQITPDVPGKRARLRIFLSRPCHESAELELVLRDPLGRSELFRYGIERESTLVEPTVPVPNPLLWDTESPHLYTVEVALLDAGTPVDRRIERFGMRTIATSAEGYLVLNGRELYLRGALDQDYYPHTIYTPFSDGELDAQFAQARHMGLNCLRTHIKITDPRYYEAADRAGLLIWTELPNWQELTEDAKRRARETMIGMVERDWNHPSIVIWTIVNENWGTDLAVNSEHRAWLVDMYNELKALDPYRLAVGNSPCFTNFHVVTDIEDFHNYYGMPDHHRQWRDWVQVFAARPSWTFAEEYTGIDRWREYLRETPSP
jgi:beta-galactosidase/beta-glucuronidase